MKTLAMMVVLVTTIVCMHSRAMGQATNPADINGDGTVDLGDLQIVAANWLWTAPPIPPVSGEEQLFVYLLNKARSDPNAYGIEAGITDSLADVDPQPPLAVNPYLGSSAKFHADEMATYDYFGHQSQVTGDWPNKMARDAGYVLPSHWLDTVNNIESLTAGYGPGAPTDAEKALRSLIEDEGVVPPGHREHLLGVNSFWASHREIGVGYAYDAASTYRNYWAIQTAYVNTSDTFITGVVFADGNSNQQYDLNEGLADVTVSTDQGQSTETNAAGGWSLEVTADTYLVQASGGSFVGTASSSVVVGSDNVEVDFISGQSAGIINFGQ